MSIRVISTKDQLLQARSSWNQLSGNNPFQSWEWSFHWYAAVEYWAKLQVVYDEDASGAWTGLAPLVGCTTQLGAQKLYTMGSGSTCTDYTRLVTKQGQQQEFTKKLVNWMKDQLEFGVSEVVEFDGVELETDTTKHLVASMQQQGYQASVIPVESCWKLDLNRSWELQNQTFSKKLRRKTKKAMKRLTDSSTTVELASESGFDSIWDQFVVLHQSRRNMLGQVGCFADQRFEQFLKNASESLIKRGLCELISISHQGAPIAAALLFHDQQNVFMYQSGFDPEYRSLEPGYMLIVAAMQWAIDRQFKTFDFLRGDEPYKARWNTKRIPHVKLRFTSEANWVSRLRGLAYRENLELRKKASWLKTKMLMAGAGSN